MNDGTIEEKEFLNLFSDEEATPRPRFKAKLKAEMLDTFEPSFKFSSIFKLGVPQFALMSVLVLAVVTVSGGLYTLNSIKNNSSTNKLNATLLNNANKKDIFENVIKNNSISILEQKSQETAVEAQVEPSTTPAVVPVAPTAPPVILKPVSEDINYRHTKITTKPGPSSNVCTFFSYLPENSLISESYDYFGKGLNFNKVVTSDEEGTLTNYSLSKNSENNSEILIFKGGEFAVKLTYDYSEIKKQPTSFPESFTQSNDVESQEDLLANKYFGTSAQINKTVQINDKEYYVIEDTSSIPCNVALPSSFPVSFAATQVQNKNIITLYFVDSITYAVDKTEVYLNDVKDGNLIYSTETQIENRFASQTEIDTTFNFEYPAPIQTIKYNFGNENEDYSSQVNNFINQSGIQLIDANNASTEGLDSIFGNSEYQYNWFSFMKNFYSPTQKGEAEYNAVVSKLPKPIELLSYQISADVGARIKFGVYDLNTNLAPVNTKDITISNASIRVNKDDVSALIYSPNKCKGACESFAVFMYANNEYKITYNSALDITKINFTTL